MAGIKRTPADIAFSKCIRERSGWLCESCGTQHPENSRGLEASHHIGRGSWGVRFSPLNAEALCTACHFRVGGTKWRIEEVLTEAEQELIRERRDDVGLAKMYRKTKGVGEIAKHYRDELTRMQELRAEGVAGRIEFEEWL